MPSNELFKQEVGSEQAMGNPVEGALWAENATREAVGTIERQDEKRVLDVSLQFHIDGGDEKYKLTIWLPDTNRTFTEKYNNKFGADAVFEKIVRDYGLETDPSEERMYELSTLAEGYDLDEEREDDDDEDDDEDFTSLFG